MFETHIDRLILLLCRLSKAGLKIKESKCKFFIRKFIFFEIFYRKNGVELDAKEIYSVDPMKDPRNIKQLQQAPMIGYPNNVYPCDVRFLNWVWVILTQKQQKLYRIIAFAEYGKMECFRNYLLGRKFFIGIHLRATTWLYSFMEPDCILAR